MVSQFKKNLSRLKSQLKLISLVGTVIINFSFPVPAFGAFLTNWFFDPDNNQLQFTLPAGTTPTYSVESKPTRLVVYIEDTKVSVNVTELYPAGLVRRVSLSQERMQQAKVIIDFAPEVAISATKVKLEQVEAPENSWKLRLLVGKEKTSTPRETKVLNGDAVTLTTKSTETTELEVDSFTPTTTSIETTKIENYESTKAEEDQAFTPPKQNRVSFQQRAPKVEFPLPNPALLAEPSIPFLVIPTEKRDGVIFPLIDTLRAQQSPTASSEISELPPLQGIEIENAFVPPPLDPETVEELNDRTTKSVDVISFGEPLPGTSGKNQLEDDASILIEAGKIISLIYPNSELELPQGVEIQEVLLLQEAITDESGRIIVPARTPVVGSFKTFSHGSQFIARAIYFNNRLIPFDARSQLLEGDLDFNEKVLAGSSTGSGLALLLLTGSGFGFLAGAALGAGSVLFTAPHSVTIEPGLIVEVRVVKDLPRSRFYDTSSF